MAYFTSDNDFLSADECPRCILGEEACTIAMIQSLYNYDQHKNEKVKEILDMLVSQNGGCCMMQQFEEHFKVDAKPVDLFEKEGE